MQQCSFGKNRLQMKKRRHEKNLELIQSRQLKILAFFKTLHCRQITNVKEIATQSKQETINSQSKEHLRKSILNFCKLMYDNLI